MRTSSSPQIKFLCKKELGSTVFLKQILTKKALPDFGDFKDQHSYSFSMSKNNFKTKFYSILEKEFEPPKFLEVNQYLVQNWLTRFLKNVYRLLVKVSSNYSALYKTLITQPETYKLGRENLDSLTTRHTEKNTFCYK